MASSLLDLLQREHRRVDAELRESALGALSHHKVPSMCRVEAGLKRQSVNRLTTLCNAAQVCAGIVPFDRFKDILKKHLHVAVTTAEIKRYASGFKARGKHLPAAEFFVDTDSVLQSLVGRSGQGKTHRSEKKEDKVEVETKSESEEWEREEEELTHGRRYDRLRRDRFRLTVERIRKMRLSERCLFGLLKALEEGGREAAVGKTVSNAFEEAGVKLSSNECATVVAFVRKSSAARPYRRLVELFADSSASQCKYGLCYTVLSNIRWSSMDVLKRCATPMELFEELDVSESNRQQLVELFQSSKVSRIVQIIFASMFVPAGFPSGSRGRLVRKLERMDVKGEGSLATSRFEEAVDDCVGDPSVVRECVRWFDCKNRVDIKTFVDAMARAAVARAISRNLQGICRSRGDAITVISSYDEDIREREIATFLKSFRLVDKNGRLHMQRLKLLFQSSRTQLKIGSNLEGSYRAGPSRLKRRLRDVVSRIQSNIVSKDAFTTALRSAGLPCEEGSHHVISSILSNFTLPGNASKLDLEGIRVYLYDEEDTLESLQNENALLRKELDKFDADFFDEIEDLRTSYSKVADRNEELETMAWQAFIDTNGGTPPPKPDGFARVDQALQSSTAKRLRNLQKSPRLMQNKHLSPRKKRGEYIKQPRACRTIGCDFENITDDVLDLHGVERCQGMGPFSKTWSGEERKEDELSGLWQDEETTNIVEAEDDIDMNKQVSLFTESCDSEPDEYSSQGRKARREILKYLFFQEQSGRDVPVEYQAFQQLDGNHDGYLVSNDIKRVLNKLGLLPSLRREVVHAIAAEVNGLDFRGFTKLMKKWETAGLEPNDLEPFENDDLSSEPSLFSSSEDEHHIMEQIGEKPTRDLSEDSGETLDQKGRMELSVEQGEEGVEKIDMEEVESMLRHRLERLKVGPSLLRQLNRFDVDQDGKLSLREFGEMTASLGLHIPATQRRRLMERIGSGASEHPFVTLSDVAAFVDLETNPHTLAEHALRKMRLRGQSLSQSRVFTERELTLNELVDIIQPFNVERAEIRGLFESLDVQTRGRVSGQEVMLMVLERGKIVKQWQRWAKLSPGTSPSREAFVASLKRFKTSSPGLMAPHQACRALKQMGVLVPQWQIESLVQMATLPQNGLVHLRKLAKLLIQEDPETKRVKAIVKRKARKEDSFSCSREAEVADDLVADLYETVACVLLKARRQTKGLLQMREETLTRADINTFFANHFKINLSPPLARIVFEVLDEDGKGRIASSDILRQVLSQETLRLALEVDEASEPDAIVQGKEIEEALRSCVHPANLTISSIHELENAYSRLLPQGSSVLRMEDLFEKCDEIGISSISTWAVQVAFHRMCNQSVYSFAEASTHGFSLMHMLDWLFPLSKSQQQMEAVFLRNLREAKVKEQHDRRESLSQRKRTRVNSYITVARKLFPNCTTADAKLLALRKWAAAQDPRERDH